MAVHPDAGKPVAKENLTDIAEAVSLYYEMQPENRIADTHLSQWRTWVSLNKNVPS